MLAKRLLHFGGFPSQLFSLVQSVEHTISANGILSIRHVPKYQTWPVFFLMSGFSCRTTWNGYPRNANNKHMHTHRPISQPSHCSQHCRAGAGTDSGEKVFTAPRAVRKIEKPGREGFKGLDWWFGGLAKASPFGFKRNSGSTPQTANPNHQVWVS